MKLIAVTLAGVALVVGTTGCSTQNQEKAKAEVKEDAHKTSEEAKKAGHEIKEDAKELSQRVDAAVKPDSESASDKLSKGSDKMKDAASHAGVKLDHAALLAKVKTKLASDAGLSTLANVNVEEDGGVISLSGTVATEEQKKAAEVSAGQVTGVVRVHNNLTVKQ